MKVSILGAGPAGSTCAYYLAKGGVEVDIFDKTEFPREKPCAGGLFNPLLYYEEFPHVENAEGVYINKVRFYCGRYEAEYSSKKPLLKMVLRRDFDKYLLDLAISEGARFYVNKKLSSKIFLWDAESPKMDTPRSKINEKPPDGTRNSEKSTSLNYNHHDKKPWGEVIVDASGVKPPHHYPRAGICMVHDFPVLKDIDTVHIHYGWEGITGYAWLYPKKGYANIGIGAYLPCRDIRKHYLNYIYFLRDRGIVSVQNLKYRAKIIPFSPAKLIYSGNLVRIGDAAGFVNPSTGEGIYFAMLSGKICAEAILNNRGFNWYLNRCKERFGKYLKRIRFGWTPALLNRILEQAVKTASRDAGFCETLTDNFFRLDNRPVALQFLKSLWR